MPMLTLRPNAAGDLTQLTRNSGTYNWEMVDEVVADDATTYVGLALDDTRTDLYNIPNHTTEKGAISSIKVYCRVWEESKYSGLARMVIKEGGTTTPNSWIHCAASSTWENSNWTLTTNPRTGAAWTWDSIDDLQIGIAVEDDSFNNVRCTQIYVEINYAPSTAWATLTLRPNAAGDLTQLTKNTGSANWEMVDEAVADDDTTTVRCASESDQKDLYNIPNHTSEIGTINSVKIYFRVKIEQPGQGACPLLKEGGTTTTGTLVGFSTSAWEDRDQTWTINPRTGSAWTWSNIDDLQIGIELSDAFGSGYAYCTQLFIQVDYIPILPTGKIFALDKGNNLFRLTPVMAEEKKLAIS